MSLRGIPPRGDDADAYQSPEVKKKVKGAQDKVDSELVKDSLPPQKDAPNVQDTSELGYPGINAYLSGEDSEIAELDATTETKNKVEDLPQVQNLTSSQDAENGSGYPGVYSYASQEVETTAPTTSQETIDVQGEVKTAPKKEELVAKTKAWYEAKLKGRGLWGADRKTLERNLGFLINPKKPPFMDAFVFDTPKVNREDVFQRMLDSKGMKIKFYADAIKKKVDDKIEKYKQGTPKLSDEEYQQKAMDSVFEQLNSDEKEAYIDAEEDLQIQRQINDLNNRKSKYSPNKTWPEVFREPRELMAQQIESFFKETKEGVEIKPEDPCQPLHKVEQLLSAPLRESKVILEKTKGGCGGAHFVFEKGPKGKKGKLLGVLKSVNGDVGTIDNQNGAWHPYNMSVFRPTDNYQSSQKEALAYELSVLFGLEGSIPPTIMLVTNSKTGTTKFLSFYDLPRVQKILEIAECPHEVEVAIKGILGEASNERLCSLQAPVTNAIPLNDLLMNWGREGLEAHPFNQDSFDSAMLMSRILGETDGHSDNYLIQMVKNNKGVAEYVIVKVDSGFSFPFENSGALNALTSLPNAKGNLSNNYIKKTLALDLEVISKKGSEKELDESSINAAVERVKFMKELVGKISVGNMPNMSHREFELRLRMFSDGKMYADDVRKELNLPSEFNISYEQRREFALKTYTKSQLKAFKAKNRQRYKVKDTNVPLFQTEIGGLAKVAKPFRKGKTKPVTEDGPNIDGTAV